MYFNNNGKAYGQKGVEEVTKIHKYVSNGIVIKADADESNYAGLDTSDGSLSYVSYRNPSF